MTYNASLDGAATTDDVVDDGMRPGDAIVASSAVATMATDVERLRYPTWAAVLIIIACLVIMTGTIVGNVLVCTAVSIVRKLRTPSNWLIVSLAVADLLVAIAVMPLATMYEVKGVWVLGQTVCDMWTSLDVLLCTASILNLCMISVDRYFVITRPFDYAMKRTPAMMAVMILSVWLLSALISIPPLFGWKEDLEPGLCELSQAIGYQFYATIGAFYLPLTVMIVIYYRIYTVSARIQRADAKSKPPAGEASVRRASSNLQPPRQPSLVTNSSRASLQDGNHTDHESLSRKTSFETSQGNGPTKVRKNVSFLQRTGFHRLSTASRERKTTKTLGVIMGAFTACWLPFFILALIKPCLNDASIIPHWLGSLLQWLGFANSFFNPIIYARFNRDFRKPFKEIIFCRCWEINSRLRSESYTEQYGPTRDSGSHHGAPSKVGNTAGVHRGLTAVGEGVPASGGGRNDIDVNHLQPPQNSHV